MRLPRKEDLNGTEIVAQSCLAQTLEFVTLPECHVPRIRRIYPSKENSSKT